MQKYFFPVNYLSVWGYTHIKFVASKQRICSQKANKAKTLMTYIYILSAPFLRLKKILMAVWHFNTMLPECISSNLICEKLYFVRISTINLWLKRIKIRENASQSKSYMNADYGQLVLSFFSMLLSPEEFE